MKSDIRLMNVNEMANDARAGLSDNYEFQNLGVSKSFIYNEMSDFPVSSRSEVDCLKENMIVLKDMSDRLAFLSKEIKYLLNLK